MRTMTEGTLSQESVTFRRNRALPGVETMDVERSARDWRCFHTTFGLTLIRSWYGEARYRHKSHAVAPGVAFCTEPGELHTTSRANRIAFKSCARSSGAMDCRRTHISSRFASRARDSSS